MEEKRDQMSLHERKLAVMKDLKPIVKDGNNSFQNYKYASEEQVAKVFRDLFVTHGITMSIESTLNSTMEIGKQYLFILDMVITLSDGEMSEVSPFVSSGMDIGDKGINKAVTSGVKYFLLRTFLSEASDSDPDADKQPEASKQNQTTKKESKEDISRHKLAKFRGFVAQSDTKEKMDNVLNRWIATKAEVTDKDYQEGLRLHMEKLKEVKK